MDILQELNINEAELQMLVDDITDVGLELAISDDLIQIGARIDYFTASLLKRPVSVDTFWREIAAANDEALELLGCEFEYTELDEINEEEKTCVY